MFFKTFSFNKNKKLFNKFIITNKNYNNYNK